METFFILSWCVLLYITAATNTTYFIGDPRACYRDGGKQYMFEVLPGLGWDNLVNENRGVVVSFNYSKCKTTEDRRYLIPDGIVTIPVKTSRMNVFSKIYDHWSNYETDTAVSINIGASASIKGVKIAGSLSSEFEHIKSHQIQDKTLTTKVQAKYVRYTAKVLPDIQLDSGFRSRLFKIANHIQHNRKLSARYESELLVRDFGSHVLTSVDAGATIVKVDQVESSLLEDKTMDKFNISMAASISLPGLVSVNTERSFSFSKSTLEKYMNSVTNSEIKTYGGPALNPQNFTVGQWTADIGNDLVIIDRDGFPLDYVITTESLPELSAGLVEELSQTVRSAITTYFKHNTYPGCTQIDAPNFSFIANVDDGTCHAPFRNMTFGGVFQKCQFQGRLMKNENLCTKLTTKNQQTQDFSCPSGFESAILHSGETEKSQHEHSCHKCWLFFHCCHDRLYYGKASYTAYWCRAKSDIVPQGSGFLFGGLYSDKTNNFVTRSRSCPQYFNAFTITSNIHVCISDDFDLGTKNAVPFGGFYSCKHGNPLVTGSPKTCPYGYSNHLATIDNDCEINYCVQTGSMSELKFPRVQLPPFTAVPSESLTEPSNYIISHNGEAWMQLVNPETKNHQPKEETWMTLHSASTEMQSLLKKFKNNHMVYANEGHEVSKGLIAGLSVGGTTIVCVVIAVVFAIRRARRLSSAKYDNLN